MAGCLRHAKTTPKASCIACILCTKCSWQVQLNSTEPFTSKSELIRTLDLKYDPKGFAYLHLVHFREKTCSRFLKYVIDVGEGGTLGPTESRILC